MKRWAGIRVLQVFVFLVLLSTVNAARAQQPEHIVVDAKAATTPFPHFWEETFGSGRAILSLRQSYRDDLRTVKQATDFKSVRFHGILNDEVGLYDPDRKTINFAQTAGQAGTAVDNSSYNFSYIDQIYDGLLENHVRPFVELSFMPKKMASDAAAIHPFWYHPNVSPPKDYAAWDAMIAALAQHLIQRYGLDEVSTWKFEVWNEPNLDFWQGNPRQSTYFTLYDHTARALKSVSPRLQVGGPSTAQAAWVAPFLAHTKAEDAPVDFVSTHVYANDTAKDVFGTNEQIPRDTMVARAVRKVHDEIAHSGYSNLPLIFSEYNASYANEPNVTDTTYMGPWLANTIRLCDGLVQNMSYWTFSDVFEEQGVARTPFYGGFGLIAADNIPKPTYNIFRILHRLGDRRLATDSDSALLTETAGGGLALALWNYAPPTGTGAAYTMPTGPAGPAKTFDLDFHNTSAASAEIWRVDDDHGNVIKAFDAMARPPGSLTRDQIARLRTAGELPAPERVRLNRGSLQVTVPAHGLAVVLLGK
ncbi:MAG TPA: glycosyl hydrolase family 39 [Acidobacteriaceae bacterium]|nr:glycosyl hydrolase family 39 [Acidobacteriaceae bacterium]